MSPIIFPGTFFLLLALERFLPGRPQPKVRLWVLKGSLFFLIAGVMNAALGPIIGRALAPYGLFDLAPLGFVGSIFVCFLALTFVQYWVHRAMHRVHFIWRWTHQMHHSAERVDVAGFSYAHPFELLIATTTGMIVAGALGAEPDLAMLTGYLGFLHNLFTHVNVKSPKWLGYIVQRPEAHLVHHERGVHAYNYGLPLWDMLFGTFRSPTAWDSVVGFWDGASKQIGPMLIGRDLATPPHAVPMLARARSSA